MRQRPDVIMIGEVRDAETLDTMLTASESGHLVLATLHTKNVEDAFGKLVSFFSGDRGQKLGSVATCVSGVISQRLLPSADKKTLVLATEVYVSSIEGQQAIRNDTLQKLPNIIQQSRGAGSMLLNDALSELVRQRKLSADVALEASYDREPLKKSLW
jgi:twitching motility protein PilT